jgi:hypothetical protein
MRSYNDRTKEINMFNRNRQRNRKLAMLGAMGLGLALLRGKRGLRRYAMARMMAGGFGRGGWGRYGGYGPGGHTDFSQMPIPPFIEARLKAWHDQAHGNVPPAASQPSDVTRV